MIVLHQFDSVYGLPNASPFCMKLEGFLRMTGLPYRIESVHDLASAPKGKAPFVDLDGERIGDSELAMRDLERCHGIDLDRDLGPGERAVAHAFRVMLEERTYFALLHERWIEERNWPLVRDGYLGDLPAPVQDAIRDGCRVRIAAQGLGAHTPEEIQELAISDIDALAAWLDRKPYFMGDAPTRADCTMHAFVCNLLGGPFVTPLRDAAQGHANLVAYNDRMLERYWGRSAPAA